MINVEIKARTSSERNELAREYLKNKSPKHCTSFVGTDHQVDTYFNVKNGRLKVRQGCIENALVAYSRDNQSGPKISKYYLSRFDDVHAKEICEALTVSLGVLAVVEKYREIYYVNNVKIHLDNVPDLGFFLEIEARDEKEEFGLQALHVQTRCFIKEFGITEKDLISMSYSDMILESKND
jgi:adenylate cyclase, class 2